MSNIPISKNQQVYTDRYGQNPNDQDQNVRSQDPYSDAVNYEQQLFDEYGIEENGDFGSEDATAYRQIAEGSPSAGTPGENELFGDMNDEELVQSGRSMATQDRSEELSEFEKGRVQLNAILTEVENSSIPASKKSSMIRQINDLKKKLEDGKEEGLDAVEELTDAARGLIEENPPLPNRLASQFSEAGLECTEDQIEKALKHAGLSEEDIGKIRLPTDAATSQNLLAFFQELDPHFAQLFADKPYGKDSMKQLTVLMQHTLNLKSAPSQEQVAAFLEPNVNVVWDGAEISRGLNSGRGADMKDAFLILSGVWIGGGSGLDLSGLPAEIFSMLTATVAGGDTQALHDKIWSGHNDFDRSHHTWNDIIRNIVSTIYEKADRSPYLLQRFLKLIPKQILEDFRDVVISHSGELNEKHAGDLITSQEAHDVLDWAIAGGEPPPFLVESSTPPPTPTPSTP